jgi:hypothetical protein
MGGGILGEDRPEVMDTPLVYDIVLGLMALWIASIFYEAYFDPQDAEPEPKQD